MIIARKKEWGQVRKILSRSQLVRVPLSGCLICVSTGFAQTSLKVFNVFPSPTVSLASCEWTDNDFCSYMLTSTPIYHAWVIFILLSFCCCCCCLKCSFDRVTPSLKLCSVECWRVRGSANRILVRSSLGSMRQLCFYLMHLSVITDDYRQLWWSKPWAWREKTYVLVHVCWFGENHITTVGYHLFSAPWVHENLSFVTELFKWRNGKIFVSKFWKLWLSMQMYFILFFCGLSLLISRAGDKKGPPD